MLSRGFLRPLLAGARSCLLTQQPGASSAAARLGLAQARPLASVSMAQIKELRVQTSAPISDCKKALEASEGDMAQAFDWLRQRGAAKASDLEKREAKEGLVGLVVAGNEAALVHVGCETDFSQRNDNFVAFVTEVAQAAFRQVPPPPSSGSFEVSLESFLAQPIQQSESTKTSVSDAVSDLVGKIRENISVKRVARVAALPQGVVGGYVHGALPGNPQVGAAAAAVAIGVAGEALATEAQLSSLRGVAKKLAMHVVAAKPKYSDPGSVPPEVLEHERSILRAQASESGKPAHIVDKMIEGRVKKFMQEMTLLNQPHMIEEGSPLVEKVLKQAGKDLGLEISLDGFVLYTK